MMEGGPMGMLEYGGPPQGRMTGYGGYFLISITECQCCLRVLGLK